jgi:hypothetical protein
MWSHTIYRCRLFSDGLLQKKPTYIEAPMTLSNAAPIVLLKVRVAMNRRDEERDVSIVLRLGSESKRRPGEEGYVA